MSDRKLGYLIICFFLLMVGFISVYWLVPLLSPGESRVVRFTEIGNLRHQDPVRVRGVSWGTAARLDSVSKDPLGKESVVYITVRGKRPLSIHRGYRIVTMDEGVMGDRTINIDCGDSAAPLVAPHDTLEGTFYAGVSEALNNAWKLREVMDTFLVVSRHLVHGTGARKSLIAQVNGMVSMADSLSRTVLQVTKQTDVVVASRIDTLGALVTSATTAAAAFSEAAPRYVRNINTTIGAIAGFAATLDKTADTLHAMSAAFSSPTGVLMRNDVQTMGEKLLDLQATIEALQQRLLQFKIYLKLM